MAILKISIIAVANFSLCRGKRPRLFPSFPDITDNNEATIETFFLLLTGSCPLVGLYLTLLSSEISTNRCLFGFEAWWTTYRSSGLSFNVDLDFLLSSFPYLCSDFACGRHTYFASSVMYIATKYQVSSAIINMYVARARQHELQHRHIQTSLNSFPVTLEIRNVFSSKDHRCRVSQVLKETKLCEEVIDTLTFHSLAKALTTGLARKKSLVHGRPPLTNQESQNGLLSEPSSWVSHHSKHRTQSFT